MNDDNSIFRHMKTTTVLDEIATDPGAVGHDDAFADDRMPNFRTSVRHALQTSGPILKFQRTAQHIPRAKARTAEPPLRKPRSSAK